MIIDYRSFIFSIPCDSSVKTNLHNEPSIIVEKEDWSIVPLLLLLRNYIRAILSSSFPEKKKKKKRNRTRSNEREKKWLDQSLDCSFTEEKQKQRINWEGFFLFPNRWDTIGDENSIGFVKRGGDELLCGSVHQVVASSSMVITPVRSMRIGAECHDR